MSSNKETQQNFESFIRFLDNQIIKIHLKNCMHEFNPAAFERKKKVELLTYLFSHFYFTSFAETVLGFQV